MVNGSGIVRTTFAAPVQILLNPDFQYSVGVVVSNALFVTDSMGRKIVKAGTPLIGNLDARITPFTVVAAGTEATVKGVLLHDIDVSTGNANGTLLIFGFVNPKKMDVATKALVTTGVKTALDGKVTFIEE